MSSTGTLFASQHRMRGWRLLAIFTIITMLMSMVVQTGFGAGLPRADAGVVPPEAIVLDTGGADDWTNPNRADLSQMGSVDDGTTVSVIYSIDDTDLLSGGRTSSGVLPLRQQWQWRC